MPLIASYGFILKYYTFLLILISCNNNVRSQNCVTNKVYYPPTGTSPARTIFSYQCNSPSAPNQPFPIGGYQPNEYSDLILNPNTYTVAPTSNICQFININFLDFSYNQLASITNLFQTLKCLTAVKIINLSNNLISSPILSTDFDDGLASQLQKLDLSNNRIPSIETRAFLKSDGTPRFLNLQYLGLTNNFLKQLDLLWPLTFPVSSVTVDLSNNPIDTLVNQLNQSYASSSFPYAATGARTINIKNSLHTTFDDTNILQYGVQSAVDLLGFLNKISNYDFRQSNGSNVFSCTCPAFGLYVVTWYRQLLTASSINTVALINQLYCANLANNVYVLNFNCPVSFILNY